MEEEVTSIIEQAHEYNKMSMSHLSTSDRVKASRLGKKIVLSLNEVYKKNQDPEIMEIMKLVTEKKRKIEKRLKGRPES